MSKVYEALKKAELESNLHKDEEKETYIQKKEVKSFEEKSKKSNWSILDSIDSTGDKSSELKEIIVLKNPNSPASEQFKKLRTKILNRLKGNNGVFLITSPLPEEGKSFVTSNLSVTFALNPDTYSLVIDADFRKPTLDKIFNIKYQYGLSDYLEGKTELKEIFYKTFLPKLSIIPAGRSNSHPSELLSSDRMKNLIREIKKRYPDRYIFIDTTPILLTSEPDILASQVDGTLIVVGFGISTREDLKRSLSMMEDADIWGIVFNKIDSQSSRYYKKGKYYS